MGQTDNFNRKVRKQLGMGMGKAANRLYRQVLFQLVQDQARDLCFRCGLKIGSFEVLSIEHKQPWLDVSSELFWDLNNVAFSHRKCNKPYRPGGKGKTHCVKGHDLAGRNSYVRPKDGKRECRVCRKVNWTKQNKRRRKGGE